MSEYVTIISVVFIVGVFVVFMYQAFKLHKLYTDIEKAAESDNPLDELKQIGGVKLRLL